MAHTFSSLFVHCFFSTKNRAPLISETEQQKLWAYIGGIARTNGIKAIEVGGTEDHCHVLLSLPAKVSPAKALQLVKAGSSKWMNQRSSNRRFEWQDGYAAFSIGVSQIDATVAYIRNQTEHHKRRSFEDELEQIFKRHGIVAQSSRWSGTRV